MVRGDGVGTYLGETKPVSTDSCGVRLRARSRTVRAGTILVVTAAGAAAAGDRTLANYVAAPEPDFGWVDTGLTVNMGEGTIAHILNVTSLRWLEADKAYVQPKHGGPATELWTHQVAVVIPKDVDATQPPAVAVLTGGCNGDSPPDASEEYLLLTSIIARRTGQVGVVVYQIPNCPIVFPSDPSKSERTEDALIARGRVPKRVAATPRPIVRETLTVPRTSRRLF